MLLQVMQEMRVRWLQAEMERARNLKCKELGGFRLGQRKIGGCVCLKSNYALIGPVKTIRTMTQGNGQGVFIGLETGNAEKVATAE